MASRRVIVQVAVPVPLRRVFDYLAPAGTAPPPGTRVRVPFGRREVVGVVLGTDNRSELPRSRLKPTKKVLDESPLLPASLLGLLTWAADYYHHPLGEVIQAALPVLLRRGRRAEVPGIEIWVLTSAGIDGQRDPLSRAPLQRRLLTALREAPQGLTSEQLRALSAGWRTALRELEKRGWVVSQRHEQRLPVDTPPTPAPVLSAAQQRAVDAVSETLDRFGSHLLFGVTGSGKTEIYLRLVEKVLAQGRQTLVLVPEIGLTPQLVDRFRSRFQIPVAVLHSGLNDTERLGAWLTAREGKAAIVLGTRSAVFTPFQHLGLIIVDEEHDQSYKQQDGFRYHARDLAVMRASRESIPVVLGSATPSLESLNQALVGSYRLLELPDRVVDRVLPKVRLLDMQRLAVNDGLSHPLVQAVRDRLAKQEQSLLFLNRRGYAPVLMCYECGWIAPCRRCDARLTLHKDSARLRCHHCGAEAPPPVICPKCGSDKLRPLGEGTERVEAALARTFPGVRIVRIDRDSTRRKGALEAKLKQIQAGQVDILVGTQMLGKGHDFPGITLVGVLNADQGLFGSDFRAAEYLVQQVMQVSGRAGRGAKGGEVLIQTWHPGHTVFTALQDHDYHRFARDALEERRQVRYPPFSHLALLRAESPGKGTALRFLENAHGLARDLLGNNGVMLMEPLSSPMERRAGRYRAQLLAQANKRPVLHRFLARWLARIEELPMAKRVRWSLDVDPTDMH